jgi:hypothetical protein
MHTTGTGHVYFRKKPQDKVFSPQPVYTVPPKREWVGLTHPQIHELDWPDGVSFEDILPFVQAIEQALKEKN